MSDVINRHLDSLSDPELCDITIEASDGDIPANRTILSINSQYFRAMFSSSSNFVEKQAGRVKMPYTETVLEKVVIYLYSGKMDCDEVP